MIAVEHDGPIAHLSLDRPGRGNALSLALLAELRATLAGLGDGVRAAVLAGRGSGFSTGADLADLTGTAADLAYDDALALTSRALRDAAFPVVAAVEGRCTGAAVDLALSCDLVVAAADAQFSVPATRLGILYAPAAVARLWRRGGSSGLRRLLLFGEVLDGTEAAAAGLVDVVTAPGGALARATAAAVAATAGVPGAVGATKALLGALEAASRDPADLEATRRALLGSPERLAAVRERHRR